MEPEEFRVIERLAKARHSSVSDLMWEAARVQLLAGYDQNRRSAAARVFLDLPDTPLPPWNELKRELEKRRG